MFRLRRSLAIAGAAFLALLFIAAGTVVIQAAPQTTVTVKLQDSKGNEITSGASLRYYDGNWKDATFDSATNSWMVYTSANSLYYEMTYNNGRQTKPNVSVTEKTVIFQTVATTVSLVDSKNTPITPDSGDGTVRYYQLGWANFGPANTTQELLPGSYYFEMTYNNGRQTFANYTISATDNVVKFQTVATKVQLATAGGVELSGGTVRYYQLGWKDFGAANTTQELLPGSYYFEMTYNNGRQTFANYKIPTTENATTETVVFKTVATTVSLTKADGTALADANTGTVRYYQLGWANFGPANTTQELLPGSYYFEMTYNNGRQTFANYDISKANALPVVFTTTAVTYQYSGSIKYYQLGWAPFSKPTMNLLPGNYYFQFDNNQVQITVGSAAITQTMLVVKLVDHGGYYGLASGTAQYYLNGWKNIAGTTTSNGVLVYGIDGLVSPNLSFAMNYAGARQEISQNIATNPIVTFKTSLVTVELKDSANKWLTDAAGTVQYYANGWKTFGTGTTIGGKISMELLPVGYSFAMNYVGARQEKGQAISLTPLTQTVTFQTANVQVELRDSSNGLHSDAGTVEYYANGWKTFGAISNGVANKELLPVGYSFAMNYVGARQEKGQAISLTPLTQTVTFQTTNVQVELRDSSNGLHSDAGTVEYYANGWKTFGAISNGVANKELLPVGYSFAMNYVGARQEKGQAISLTPLTQTVTFQTANVQVELRDSSNGLHSDAGTVEYYANGWKTFGAISNGVANKELLPVGYSFAMNYVGARQEKGQAISLTPLTQTVTFQTANVAVSVTAAGGNPAQTVPVQYYANGWKNLGTTDTNGKVSMELLPVGYSFSATYNNVRKELGQNVNTNPNVTFAF
ncbi:hypothetical protein OZ401_003454 [Candidatus Chlorohelix allophototropha]|uniref:Uncharacterized protein n=1 Tax=Candidatus Chlorohelix allophototropha TaxID=3003348 RepID=A0ABY9B9D7_9CHLR|nr:hypothetical protein OZ401_003454 [Chloroflexota bacterium L227-S17]